MPAVSNIMAGGGGGGGVGYEGCTVPGFSRRMRESHSAVGSCVPTTSEVLLELQNRL